MLFYANFLTSQKWCFNFETSIALSISRGKLNVIYISESKMVVCECNALHEIKQGIVFRGHPVLYCYK